MLNYAKWAVAAGALFWLYCTERIALALVFAAAFALALLDDSLMLHETWGARIGWSFLAGAGEMNMATGELVVFALYGLAFFAGLCFAWPRSGVKGRRLARNLTGLLVLVGACAILADLAHAAVPIQSIAAGILGLVEEGGEMLILTAIVAYCLRSAQR